MSKLPESSARRWLAGLGVVVGLALVLRLLMLLQVHGSPLGPLLLGDAAQYDAEARKIAAGAWLGDEVYYQDPLYSYFMAVIYRLFGVDLLPLRIVQALLGVASVLAIALAGERLYGRAAGLVAGLLLALNPMALYFGFVVQKSILDMALFSALLLLVGQATRAPTPRVFAASGAALGLLVLSRGNAMVLLPVLLAWAAWGQPLRVAARRSGALAGGTAAVLLPVALRNLLVGGMFTLTTARLGPNLYIGNNPASNGSYLPLRAGRANYLYERADAQQIAEAALGRTLTSAEVSDWWTGRVLDWIQSAPGDWLRLMGTKVLLLVNQLEIGGTESVYTYQDWAPSLVVLLAAAGFAVLLPLAVLGAVLTAERRSSTGLLVAMALTYGASVVAFFVFDRFRFLLVMPATLLAGAGLAALPDLVRRGLRARIGVGLLAAAATAAVVHLPLDWSYPLHTRRAEQGRGLLVAASSIQRSGGDREVVDGLARRAVEVWPDDAFPYVIYGEFRLGWGEPGAAAALFDAALRQDPDSRAANAHLGVLLANRDGPERALPYFERAAAAGQVEDQVNLAQALADTGQPERARVVIGQAMPRADAEQQARLQALLDGLPQ